MSFRVEQNKIGERLDIFLVEKDSNFSRSQWQKKIKRGEVLVNEKESKVNYRIKDGDIINLKFQISKIENRTESAEFKEDKLKLDFDVEIIFETQDYLIINKPAGLVVHTDRVNKDNTLADWLVENYPKIKGIGEDKDRSGIVHRLDKDVSGLMVVAKTQEMFENLKGQFKTRKIEKEYEALVYGKMEQVEGRIELPIIRSKSTGMFVAQTQEESEGRKAITEYETEKKFINYTLLKIKILTGRTHQIRVHLRAIGHSIVGDELYATKDVRKKLKKVKLDRLWLYAARLRFKDLEGETQEFKIDRPEELKNILEKIK